MTADVLVIVAGPAGASTAAVVRQAGCEPLVVKRHQLVFRPPRSPAPTGTEVDVTERHGSGYPCPTEPRRRSPGRVSTTGGPPAGLRFRRQST